MWSCIDDDKANAVTSAGIEHMAQIALAEMDHHRLLGRAFLVPATERGLWIEINRGRSNAMEITVATTEIGSAAALPCVDRTLEIARAAAVDLA